MTNAIEPEPSATARPDQPEPSDEGGVRWRRFTAVMLTAVAVCAGLFVLTAQGALAVEFSISGIPFTVTADHLHGDGFEQFAVIDNMVDESPNAGDTGGQLVLVVSAIRQADLVNLCQTVSLGGINLMITAGDNGTPVHGTNLVVDGDQIIGSEATFTDIEIGRDASTLDQVPNVLGPKGLFAQQATIIEIDNLRQNNFATTAAVFTLPNLHLRFTTQDCPL